jgi:hypothetical protein
MFFYNFPKWRCTINPKNFNSRSYKRGCKKSKGTSVSIKMMNYHGKLFKNCD